MSKHTPGPWGEWENGAIYAKSTRPGHTNYDVVIARTNNENVEATGNARHIVRCVNAHDDLLAACKAAEQALCDIINAADNGAPYSQAELADLFLPVQADARAAIAKAEGGQ